jgi:RHS repeat-associated protein
MSTTGTQSAFLGSQAFNRISEVDETVIPNAGSLLLNIALIKTTGKRAGIGLDISLSYSLGTPGSLGLPLNWSFGIPVLHPSDALEIDGRRFIVDPNWTDARGYKSGLKYVNNHGISFVDHLSTNPLPYGTQGGNYRFTYSDVNGDVYYFDSSGKLVMKADAFANFLYYAYTTNGLLDHVLDSFGQKTTFGYNLNQIIITGADGSASTLNYSGHGVDSYVNPLGETTAFTYITYDGLNVVSTISYPTGKTTVLTYVSIAFLDTNQNRLSIPAISEMVCKDHSGATLAHTQYAYGTNSGGNTYTGATQSYTLSSGSDGLLDSNNTLYRYNVETRQLDASGKILGLNDTYYNFAHVPVTVRDFIIDGTGAHKGYSQTSSTYEIAPNQHNRQPNYLSPKSTETQFFASAGAASVTQRKSTFGYDDFGNKTSEEIDIFEAASGAYVSTLSLSVSYFTDTGMKRFDLPKSWEQADHLASSGQQITYTLNADKNAIASSATAGKQTYGPWAPWKMRQRSYDGAGRIISETLKWLSTSFEGIPQTTTDYAYAFDASSFSVSTVITNANGLKSTSAVSTLNGQKLSETLPSGATRKYAYDALGRLVSTTWPSGKVATQSYKTFAKDGENSTTKTSPMGYHQTTLFDALGRQIAQTDNGYPGQPGQTRQLSRQSYDMLGNVISEVDLYGNTSTCTYLSNGQPDLSTDPFKNQRLLTYDFATNTTQTFVNNVLQKKVVLDNSGNTVLEEAAPNTSNPDGASQYTLKRASSYDGAGHLTSKTISRIDGGTETQISSESYTYDVESNRTGVYFSAPDGSSSQKALVFDLLNNELSHVRTVVYTDKRSYTIKSATNSFNALGQNTKVTNQASQSEIYTYTPDGLVESKTTFGGDVLTTTYNTDGEKTKETWNDPSATSTAFRYDKDGRVTSVSDASGTMSTTYSLDGIETAITYPDGKSVTYAVDQFSRKVKQTDTAGAVSTFAFNALNQLVAVKSATDSLNYNFYSDVTKNLTFGSVKSVTLSGKYTETYRYDAHGNRNQTERMDLNGARILSESSVTDPQGKVTSSTLTSALAAKDPNVNRTTSYAYDSFNQLTGTKVTDPNGGTLEDETFQYDGNTNVMQRVAGGVTTDYTYNAIDQLTSYFNGSGERLTQSYDTNGRLTQDGTGRSYSYDIYGRLLGVAGRATTKYSYYPNGLMQTRNTSGRPTQFYYNSKQQVVTAAEGAATTSFLLVGARRFASYVSGAGTYFTTTQRQDTVMSLSETVSLIGTTSYLAYGTPQKDTLGLSAANAFAWNQEYQDPDQGLVYLRARYYDPASMRFITRDTKQYDNRYAFGSGDPINNIDPTGHDAVEYALLGVGLGVGAAVAGTVAYLAITYGAAATAAVGGVGAVAGIFAGGGAAAAAAALGFGAPGIAVIAGGVAAASTLAVGASAGSTLGVAIGAALGGTAGAYLGLGTAGTAFTTAVGGALGGVIGTAAEPIVGAATAAVGSALSAGVETVAAGVSAVAETAAATGAAAVEAVTTGAAAAAETAAATGAAAVEAVTTGAAAVVEAATTAVAATVGSFEASDLLALAAIGLLAIL